MASHTSMKKLVIMLLTIFGWIVLSTSDDSKNKPIPYKVSNIAMNTAELIQPKSSKDKKIIHCYVGVEKNLSKLFEKAEIWISTDAVKYKVYVGGDPEKLFSDYKNSFGSFFPSQERISVNPFNRTCILVDTEDNYRLRVIITEFQDWYVYSMVAGIILIFVSRTLSRNPAFFYISSSILGVIILLAVIMYFIYRSFTKQTVITTTLLGGGLTLAYNGIRQTWIVQSFDDHFMVFLTVSGFVSFLIAYRVGPPINPRTKNVMMWALQGVGVALVYFSSWLKDVTAAISFVTLFVCYFVQYFVRRKQRQHSDKEDYDTDKSDEEEKTLVKHKNGKNLV